MMRRKAKLPLLFVGLMTIILSSCSVSRHLPEDAYLLDKVKVISEESSGHASELKSKVVQQPNTRFLGVARLSLRLYCLAGVKDNAINRMLKNMGEEPRVYDESKTKRSRSILRQTLINQGYLHADVEVGTHHHGHKMQVNYYVHPGRRYNISSLKYLGSDSALMSIVYADTVNSKLKVGAPFDINMLNEERTRLTSLLHDHGYYSFKKDLVTYRADTARNSTDVDLTIRVRTGLVTGAGRMSGAARANGSVRTEESRRMRTMLKPYTVDEVIYQLYPMSHTFASDFTFSDTLLFDGGKFMYDGEPDLRLEVLKNASLLQAGSLYNASKVRNSYSQYGRLGALKYTNINFEETSDSTLRCNVVLFPAKKYSAGLETDITYTSGDLGASGAISFTNRNLFRGSETFTFKLRGAIENTTQLVDYNADKFYREYGADLGLNIPRFIAPFVSDEVQRRSKATTQIELQANMQKRPEFDRNVFTASWGYLWNGRHHAKHRVDLLSVNYVAVPYTDQYFVDNYLNQFNSKNSILKFNYEDLFILRTGYSLNYVTPGQGEAKDYFDVSHSVRFAVESSGNLLYMLSNALQLRKDSLGQYRMLDIAYAQYVKNDFSWTMNLNFNRNNSLLFHIESGVAFPYGNTRMLPFEKRYYAGGANSIRGWGVRELGPGCYLGDERTIDYINHSGDVKLELGMEYRTHLFWRLYGALFVDAGNIWTIYNYDDQPGGQFLWNNFYRQIAVAYGTGLRMDFNVVVLRFDVGMKAIDPVYGNGPNRYPILHPSLRRDLAWHVAVGYPF